jgi:uncharacterized SAM-binding protein YcdF (DUF218 family)
MAQVFDPAYLDIAIKAILLLLLIGGCIAVFELIRYLRTLRHGRELNHRLVLRRAQEEMGNDPRLAAPAPEAARPGVLARAVGKSIQTVGIAAILLVALAAFAVPFLGPWLEHQDELQRADAIVPLPGDPRRLLRAAELYKQGYAPRILLGKGAAGFGRIEAMQADAGIPATDFTDLQLRTLERAGVPRESIDLADLNEAGVTGAADAVRRQFGDRKARVIVVATGVHAMRTRLAFEQALPRSSVMVATAPDGSGAESWWSSHDTAVETIAEASRLAHFWLLGRSEPAPPETSQAGSPAPESTGSISPAARQ